MYTIVYRSKPGQPWIFITYHSGTREEAEQSAKWTEEQERKVFKRAQTVVKVLDAESWDRGLIREAKKTKRTKQTIRVEPIEVNVKPAVEEIPDLMTLFKEVPDEKQVPLVRVETGAEGPDASDDGVEEGGIISLNLEVGDDS